ncbi:MAG: S26 family signal peptidase [Candidatus Thermoplasmatota archaeon]|nr:S26 family signal peptidase [Candidatus Thermoplasmatota archaeon]
MDSKKTERRPRAPRRPLEPAKKGALTDPKLDRARKPILGERSFVYDLMGAAIILLILIGSLYTYTGNWPPLVVVQSGSMQHSDTRSYVGTIDTGDLVFVKSLGPKEEIIPYINGLEIKHRTYDSWGDVIIFRPNGDSERTAIIHRSVVYIEFNETTFDPTTWQGGAYDVPSMGLYHVTRSFSIKNYEWPKSLTNDLVIDVERIIDNFRTLGIQPHGGYLTKGDDNSAIDQTVPFHNEDPPFLLPVLREWIIGKSRGELPWFGIIKLKIEGRSDPPENSVRLLVIALIALVLTPFLLDLAVHYVQTRLGKKVEEAPQEAPLVPDRRRMRPPPRRGG